MAMAADWSSLPSDLLNLVGDGLLSTGDLDWYASFRAVCHNWRMGTADQSGPDRRFRPRSWVMLQWRAADAEDSGRRLFLNVDTGRFVLKDMPMLADNHCVATDDDGILLLKSATDKYKYSAVNPFTRVWTSFPSRKYPMYGPNDGRMLGAGSSPKVIMYWFKDHGLGDMVDLERPDEHSIFWAKPDLQSFASVVSCQGHVYAMDSRGTIIAAHEGQWGNAPVVAGDLQQAHGRRPSFLVDNAGELVVVRFPAAGSDGIMRVFTVDLDNKALRMINSIGDRAIFIGRHRSLSVNAAATLRPAIEPNCIYYEYYTGGGLFESSKKRGIYRYCLDSDREMLVEPMDNRQPLPRPLSLARILMDYANYVADLDDLGA